MMAIVRNHAGSCDVMSVSKSEVENIKNVDEHLTPTEFS